MATDNAAVQFGRMVHHRVRLVRLSAIAGLWLVQGGTAFCQAVPICDALTLYGNAANAGLCKNLSMGTHWVCDLTDANPDIHATFNAATPTPLHITVNRAPPNVCGGNSELTGTWNAAGRALAIAGGEPNFVCAVSIQSYVDRFNAQNRLPAAPPVTACRTAFINNQRISPAVQTFYLNLCNANACP